MFDQSIIDFFTEPVIPKNLFANQMISNKFCSVLVQEKIENDEMGVWGFKHTTIMSIG